MKATALSVDLAENVFQLCALNKVNKVNKSSLILK